MQSPEQGAPSVIIANNFDDNNHVDNNGNDDDYSYDENDRGYDNGGEDVR